MTNFFALLLIAIIIEGITTYIKTWFVDKKPQWQTILTCVLGILIALAYRVDLLALFEVTSSIPYVGEVLTGILLSRGSNYLYDLIKKILSVQSGGSDLIDTSEEGRG